MRKIKYQILILVTLLVSFSCDENKNIKNTETDYSITPKPNYLKVKDGRFRVDADVEIQAENNLKFEADYLKDLIALSIGAKNMGSGGNTITLKIDKAIEHQEGYEIMISYDDVLVKGKTAIGVFFGVQTLRQLISSGTNKHYYLPAVHIKDEPRFEYRGVHLDVARYFFPVSTIKKYIDLLSIHKMNKFHFHLTEDQGWRIEIKKYPKLTEVGSVRNGTIVGNYPGSKNDNKVHKGFYTQEEIKDLVKYATDRHITVIPEIELPGHSSAAIAAYPYLSCFPNEKTIIPKGMISDKSKEEQSNGRIKLVQESWGVYEDVFVPSEKTFSFLEDVLTEVMALFPSKYIHIGGDECPKENWKRSKFCQDLIKRLNLKDEHGLQSYFITRIEKFLNKNGRDIIGWDEILEGGLAPNATVMSWRGEKGGIEAAKQHHNVIMTPSSHMYFDYYQAKPVDKEPIAIGGFTSIEKVYSYNPIPKELSNEEAKYILGAQANVWTEYIPDEMKLEYMLVPRIAALSEVQWTQKEYKDLEDFKVRLPKMLGIYKMLGYNQAKPYFTPKGESE